MAITKDENTSNDALVIVQKYEVFRDYMYPIMQRSPREHGVLRDVMLEALFAPIGSLYHAAKSQHVSKLHIIDADFATLRSHLRFLVLPKIKIISPAQHAIALAMLAEPGKMLGAWIKKLGGRTGK